MIAHPVRAQLPRIYPITDTKLSKLSHADQVKKMIDGGATLIQLRDKHASPQAFFRDAATSLHIASEGGAKLIINDRVDIAHTLAADGVHLGQTDMPADAARKLLGDKAIIGLSTHNIEQAEAASHLPIDYLAFGPIFSTTTKINPDPVAGLQALRTVRSLVGSLPLVAIGGITRERIPEVLAMGADAVAVITALLSLHGSIAENLKQLSTIADSLARDARR